MLHQHSHPIRRITYRSLLDDSCGIYGSLLICRVSIFICLICSCHLWLTNASGTLTRHPIGRIIFTSLFDDSFDCVGLFWYECIHSKDTPSEESYWGLFVTTLLIWTSLVFYVWVSFQRHILHMKVCFYTRTKAKANTWMHTLTHKHPYIPKVTHMYQKRPIYTKRDPYIPKETHIYLECIHSRTSTCVHARTHTRTHTHIHTHTYTLNHVHTHSYTQSFSRSHTNSDP